MQVEDRLVPSREDCVYTSCYCEENVWKLCEFVRDQRTAPLDHLLVVFISNASRMVPLWRQKSGRGDQPVIWPMSEQEMLFQDYHVVLLQVSPGMEPLVYDLDSDLLFPCSLQQYGDEALRSDQHIKTPYHRKLRVVSADCFLSNFASDRSHMRNADGSWKMPPPRYPPIHTAESQMNLDDFISMSGGGWGRVFSLDHFLHRFLGVTPTSSAAAAAATSS